MTNLIIAVDAETFIHKIIAKSPDEVRREIETGVFEFPIPLANPAATQLRDYVLIAERDKDPLLSRTQLNILDLLSLGASETEIARSMQLSFSGVRHHIDSLKNKFSVSTREELISIYTRIYRR